MRTMRAIFHLLRADFFERVRSSAFLIILGLIVFAGYFYTPVATAGYRTLSFGMEDAELWYRGIYNSAWISAQVALWATIWLLIAGFFLVRNAIERDIHTGVGEIIATTPLTRPAYTLGKMLSNLATLFTMLVVIIVATGAMQFLRGESTALDPWQLVSPFVFMGLPTIAIVAALAVFFECIPFLRGTVGSVVYFFFCVFLLIVSVSLGEANGSAFDMLGMSEVFLQMEAGVRASIPNYVGEMNLGTTPASTAPKTFVWQGLQWTGDMLVSRGVWLVVAFSIAIVSAVFFSRFDPAKERKARAVKKSTDGVELQDVPEIKIAASPAPVQLTPLAGLRIGGIGAQVRVLIGELRVLGKEVPWWWYIGALVWIVLGLFLPYDIAYRFFLPIAWLWPLPIWSSLGNRERQKNAHQLVFSSAAVLGRQLPMHYLAGVIITLAAASGILVRVLVSGDPMVGLIIVLGALFIPALALCLGVWTSGRRLFEMLYLALWYIGAINQTPAIDFMGITRDAIALNVPYIFAGVAGILLILAVIGRSRQMRI